jgi:uncharacterized protein (TIGR03435 family)
MLPSGLFVAARETVARLIMQAYDVRHYQIVDGPDWMTSALFDIEAKAPESFQMNQTNVMVQRLLADRFGLVVHRDARVVPTFALQWADRTRKLGRGIRPSATRCDDVPPSRGRNGTSSNQSSCESMYGWDQDGLFVRRSPLSSLIALLTGQTGRPVIDETGLTGNFDIDVKSAGLRPGRVVSPDIDGGDGGTLFTAVREQLGLRLVPTKHKLEVLIIERLDRPTPN